MQAEQEEEVSPKADTLLGVGVANEVFEDSRPLIQAHSFWTKINGRGKTHNIRHE